MKELLNYYYYILVDRINMRNHNYYFNYQNNYFCLYKVDYIDDIDNLFWLNNYMLYNNYKINRIIPNRDSKALTMYNNNYYSLVLLTYNNDNYIHNLEYLLL